MRNKKNSSIGRSSDFEVRLPRRSKVKTKSLMTVLKKLSKGQGRKLGGSGSSRVFGARLLKGARGRIRLPKLFPQRVIVKARVVTGQGPKSTQRLRAHLKYLARTGVGINEESTKFFSSELELDRLEVSQMVNKWRNDPHHFRFIVSPENSSQLDLQAYLRRVVSVMEKDLKTKLEWVGICHYDTDNPHGHLIIRGVRDDGNPLLITRDYLSHGIRHVAEKEATIALGERDGRTIQIAQEKRVCELGFTPLDYYLRKTQEKSSEKVIEFSPFQRTPTEWQVRSRQTQIRRLTFLEQMNLARQVKPGVWTLSEQLEDTLRGLAKKKGIEKLVSPYLEANKVDKDKLVIHSESDTLDSSLKGEVIAKGIYDELYEKKFLLLSGADDTVHFIPLGKYAEPSGFESKVGSIVEVSPVENRTRAEEVILRFLNNQGGVFNLNSFTSHVTTEAAKGKWNLPDNLSVEDYVGYFAIRCESLTRNGLITQKSEVSWDIPSDLLTRVQEQEKVFSKALKFNLYVESDIPLFEQVHKDHAVWIDRYIGKESLLSGQDSEFGRKVIGVLKDRKSFLSSQGIEANKNTYPTLLKRDLKRLVEKYTKRYGQYKKLSVGATVRGSVVGYEKLADGPRMIVRTSDGFVVRKVNRLEGQRAFNTEVFLSKYQVNSKGKKKEVIKAKFVDPVLNIKDSTREIGTKRAL